MSDASPDAHDDTRLRHQDRPVTREDVLGAYRFLLGREPENEGSIAYWMETAPSLAALRKAFLASDECRSAISAPADCSMAQGGHDLSLNSGERQVASSYGSIRADHRYRYEWADSRLPLGGFGLDAFCGNGYGAWLLSQNRSVWGLDGSSAAIAQAERFFRTNRNFFSTAYFPFDLPAAAFDFIVALESIEHVEDGAQFFETLVNSLKPGGHIVFSTPCEDHLPHQMTGNHFHFRHYTLDESLALAKLHGLTLTGWAGQNVYTFQPDGRQGGLLPESAMGLIPRTAGQFIIISAQKR